MLISMVYGSREGSERKRRWGVKWYPEEEWTGSSVPRSRCLLLGQMSFLLFFVLFSDDSASAQKPVSLQPIAIGKTALSFLFPSLLSR